MREAGAVVVALGGDEDLCLVHQAAEGLRMDDPVAIALKWRAKRAVGLLLAPQRRIGRRREIGEELGLPCADSLLQRGFGLHGPILRGST